MNNIRNDEVKYCMNHKKENQNQNMHTLFMYTMKSVQHVWTNDNLSLKHT